MLCEKPLAPTPKQTVELFEAAKEKGVFLMEAYAYFTVLLLQHLKKKLKKEQLEKSVILNLSF